MIKCRFEPFIGLRLLVYENRLQDRGTISECFYSYDGIMTFTTETGEYSFYYVMPKMVHLKNGDWKLLGSTPRWAYVCQSDSPYVTHLEVRHGMRN
jgi:hypothetical protein